MKYTEIKRLLKEIVNANPALPITGEVIAVDGETCRVKISEMELSGVRLKAAVTGSDDYIMLVPKIGSVVILLSRTGDLDDLMVIQTDQVERIEYKQNGLEVIIDSSDAKISVKNNAVSLFDLMGDLTDLLKQFQVATPAGASGTPLPPTIAALNAFEANYKQLLK